MAVGTGDLAAFIAALTEETSPDTANDMLILRLAADGSLAKISPGTIASGSAPAWVQIAETELASPAANFDFTSIAATWRHLKVIMLARSDVAGTGGIDVHLTFNADAGNNYDVQLLNGNNTTASATVAVAGALNYITNIPKAGDTANMAGVVEITISNYRGTTFFKRFMSHGGSSISAAAAGQFIRMASGQWHSTNAITRMTLTPTSGNFIAGSVATLYGML